MEREAKYDSVSRPQHYCIEGLEDLLKARQYLEWLIEGWSKAGKS